MWNKLNPFKRILLLKYNRVLFSCAISPRRCAATWIVIIGMMYMVMIPKRGLVWQLPSCNGCIRGWCLSSTISIPAVWCISPVANVWTKAKSPLTHNSAFWTMKRHFNPAGMCPAVNSTWLSGLIPIQWSTVSFLGGICYLHLVDTVQQSMWTACSSHWKDITTIATALYQMHFALLRRLKCWLWSTESEKLANLFKHQAMWFSSSPFGIAHHYTMSSRVLISGCRVFIIRMISTLVRGILWSWCCLAALTFSSHYWNTSFWGFIHKIRQVASSWFECWYTCLWSIIALSGSAELAFDRLPSWQIWSEKWFKRCIVSKLKSNSLTTCCAISHSIGIISSSTQQLFAATERLLQAGSLSRSSWLAKVSCFINAS